MVIACCRDVYRSCQINVSGLRFTNKRPNDKEEDLVKAFFRRSITLLNDRLGVMLINAT